MNLFNLVASTDLLAVPSGEFSLDPYASGGFLLAWGGKHVDQPAISGSIGEQLVWAKRSELASIGGAKILQSDLLDTGEQGGRRKEREREAEGGEQSHIAAPAAPAAAHMRTVRREAPLCAAGAAADPEQSRPLPVFWWPKASHDE